MSAALVIIFLCISAYFGKWFYAYWLERKRRVELASLLFGPPELPIIGNTLDIPRDPYDSSEYFIKHAKEALERGECVVKWSIPGKLLVLPVTGEAVKAIAESNTELEKGPDYQMHKDWLGNGLLTSGGEIWRGKRKMLTPMFHFKLLDGYMDVFDRQSKILVKHLEKFHNKGQVDVYPMLKCCALDIICEAAMGISMNSMENPDQPYVHAVEEYNMLAFKQFTNPFYRLKPIWYAFGYRPRATNALKVLHETSMKVVRQRSIAFEQEQRLNGGVDKQQKLSFLDMLLSMRDENKLGLVELREEVDTFLFAGHDTTAHAISWTLWCLATHPEIQEKVYDELTSQFPDRDSTMSINELKELKYLDNVVKESMRIFSPVPVVQRQLVEELEMGGKIIPKGSTIAIMPLALHHNYKVFPNPEKYDPDRFLPEKSAGRHSYDYIPFSAGPRNCIGQKFAQLETKTTIANIIRNFRVSTNRSMYDNKRGTTVVLTPSLGIPVKLSIRE